MVSLSTPALRLASVQERLERAAARCGRSSHEVELLAVTKLRPAAEVEELYQLGLRCFGENRVAEALDKRQALAPDIAWHLIGHLQSNKVSFAANFTMVQSVDRAKIARGLEAAAAGAGRRLEVLIEVNTGGEAQKAGTTSEGELHEVVEALLGCPHLEWKGLMTMAPFVRDEVVVRGCFRRLFETREILRSRYPDCPLPVLSMGMSNDFEWAVAEGSTLVRIGTALFEAPQ